MRRPWLATVAAVFESILGVALLATAVVMVVAARTAGSLDTGEGAAAGILSALGLAVIASCVGMLKRKVWGWWLAEAANLVGLVVFLWDPVTRRVRPDPDELAFIGLLGMLLLVLLLAPVRSFLLRKKGKLVESNVGS